MSILLTITKPNGETETRDIELSECTLDGVNLIIHNCPVPGETTALPLFTVKNMSMMRDALTEAGTVQDFTRGKARRAVQAVLNYLAGRS